MTATIIGSQLGDEGKGGIVDLFSNDADVVVRFQGGDNAGHTVEHDGEEHKLRLTPSGVIQGSVGVLGSGCVVNLETLFGELAGLRERGLSPDVRVAKRAHVVLPYHRVLDDAEEASKTDTELAVGTTGNGIGPAYQDKTGRHGIRVGDLLDPAVLRARLEYVVPRKRALAEEVYGVEAGDAFDVERLHETFQAYGSRLADEGMVVDAGAYLTEQKREGKTILFESAQGTHIDLDHGNYPYVTSSNPTAGGAIVGAGVGPDVVSDGHIVGVVKAYLTRVGEGPMPTELSEERADRVREKVGGFGTVTGRPRRIGWLDLPVLRHAAQVNGYTGIALNHVDALSGLEELRICHSYEFDGETVTTTPPMSFEWERCEPLYESFEPWPDQDWAEIADEGHKALPDPARRCVEYVGETLDLPLYSIGVGPDREETIVLQNPLA